MKKKPVSSATDGKNENRAMGATDAKIRTTIGRALYFLRRRSGRVKKKKKNGARVTDARTYTNTMNCVMAGNSCAPRRKPMRSPEWCAARVRRIRTPTRTRPPCFSTGRERFPPPPSSFTFYLPPSQNDWWIIIFLLITPLPPPPTVARRPWQPPSVFFGHPKNTGKMAFRKFYRPGYCSRQADDGLMSDRWGTTAAAGERDDVRQRAVAARRHRGPTTMKTLRPHPNVEELFYEFLIVGRPTGRK